MKELEITEEALIFPLEGPTESYFKLGGVQKGKLLLENGLEINLGPDFFVILDFIARNQQIGKTIKIITEDGLISPEKAANILGVSRPLVYQLLDEGIIPWVYVGKHRRVFIKSVLEYEKNRLHRGKKETAITLPVGEKELPSNTNKTDRKNTADINVNAESLGREENTNYSASKVKQENFSREKDLNARVKQEEFLEDNTLF